MANTIQLQEPARISRNTAADGDFLWNMDFARLWANDNALKDAIEQSSQDYTAGDGIDIDPSTKTISVKTKTGIEKTEEGLSVNIEGVDGAKVELQGNTFKVSAYNAEPEIEGLNDNLDELQNELDAFENEVAEKYITSAAVSTPNTQYVYTTSGWQALAGGEVQELAYWRPYFDSTDNKIKWEQQPSSVLTPPSPSVSLKGPQGDKGDKGTDGTDGVSPTVALSPIEDETKTGTEIVITDKNGDHIYSAWNGETGPQGFSVELDDVKTVPGGKEITLKWGDPEFPSTSAFVIPSGDKGGQGDPGIQGPDGYTPSVSAKDISTPYRGKQITFYWPAAAGKPDVNVNIEDGFSPTVSESTLPPDNVHKNGGSAFTIVSRNTTNTINIWHGNNGQDGDAGNAEGYITGTGTALDPFVLTDEAIEAIETVSGKMVPPTKDTGANTQYKLWGANYDSQTSGWLDAKSLVSTWCAEWGYDDYVTSAGLANNKNWVLSTNNQGKSQWIEANYATEDWLDDHYLPLSGGTVSGETVISGSGNFDNSNLKFTRENKTNIGRIGLNRDGGLSIKSSDSDNNNYTQINISPSGDNDKRIALQKMVNNETSYIGYLIPAMVHTSVPSTLTNDGILHIIVES